MELIDFIERAKVILDELEEAEPDDEELITGNVEELIQLGHRYIAAQEEKGE